MSNILVIRVCVSVYTHTCTFEHKEISAGMKLSECWSYVYVNVPVHSSTFEQGDIYRQRRFETVKY